MSFRPTLTLLSQKSKSKSAAWVARQHRDPFVKKRIADPLAFRARSAFKLLEINEQWGQFLDQPDVHSVVDLGAAPGGWSQVVASKFGWTPTPPEIAYLVGRPTKEQRSEGETEESVLGEGGDADALEPVLPKRWKKKKTAKKQEVKDLDHFDPLDIDGLDSPLLSAQGRGKIVAVDLLSITSIPGVDTIRADFMLESTGKQIQRLLATPENPRGKADVILSDMAANSSGNVTHDIQSSLEICEAVFEFARFNLRSAEGIGRRKGGVLLMKFFAHPLLEKFRVERLEPNFSYVYYVKPESSRSESREGYFLCQGWNH